MSVSPQIGVVFDLDGTLVDSAHGIARALNVLREGRGMAPVPVHVVKQLVSYGAPQIMLMTGTSSEEDVDHCVEEFRAIYASAPTPPEELFAGVEDVLRDLSDAGTRLAICTNKPTRLTEKMLDDLDLRRYFRACLCGDYGGPTKPDPAHLVATLDCLGVKASEAIFVGDSELDAKAAKAAGITFVHAGFGYAMADPRDIPCHARVETFVELGEVFRALHGARLGTSVLQEAP